MALNITPEWLNAIVSAGWLVLAVALLCLLYPMLRRIVSERAFSVEIAGFKLTAQETADGLNNAIKDLQESVRRLEQSQHAPMQHGAPDASAAAPAMPRGGSILWVDDFPINNALIFEKLEDDGFRVDRALSTREGLKLFANRSYDIVLSDMGRKEDGGDIADAGVKLTAQIRQSDGKIPIFIFCSNRAREHFGAAALKAGASNITSSTVELYGFIAEALQEKTDKKVGAQ